MQFIEKLVKKSHQCEVQRVCVFHCMQVDKERNFVQIYSFTEGCNWLDVVEVRFRIGKEPGKVTIVTVIMFYGEKLEKNLVK